MNPTQKKRIIVELKSLEKRVDIFNDYQKFLCELIKELRQILGTSRIKILLEKYLAEDLKRCFLSKDVFIVSDFLNGHQRAATEQFHQDEKILKLNSINVGRVLSDRLITQGFQYIIPLIANRQLYGGLIVDQTIHRLKDDPAFRTALFSLAKQIAIALKTAQARCQFEKVHLEKKIFLEIGKRISSSLELKEVLTLIMDSLNLIVPFDSAGIFLIDEKTGNILSTVLENYSNLVEDKIALKVGQGITGWAIKTGQGIIVPDVDKDSRYFNARPETRSELCVPLKLEDRVIGAFNLESNRLNAYSEYELDLLSAFAGQAAVAVENARLYEESVRKKELENELEVAAQIQKAILPTKLPYFREYSISALHKPVQAIGGDLYDVIQLERDICGLAIGDVSGKGIPGAILMSNLLASFRSKGRSRIPINKIVMILNRILFKNTESDQFATFCYALLSQRQRELICCNAGHNPPIVLHKNGRVELLEANGLPLGVIRNARYSKSKVRIDSGDIILFYTDGATEAFNPKFEQFGQKRLIKTIKKYRDLKSSLLTEKILDRVERFVRGEELQDDITLIVVKIR